MIHQGQQVTFRGNSLRTIRYPALVFFPCLALTLYLLIGAFWLRLAALFVFLSLVPCLFFYLGSLLSNRFSFDDETQSIAKPPRQTIPFREVESIEIKETCGQLSVFVRGQNRKMCTLVQGLSLAEKERLTAEFGSRFPAEMMRYRRLSTWVPLSATGLAFAFVSVFLLIRSHQVFAECPQVKEVPENKAWHSTPEQLEGETYSLAGVSFLVPDSLMSVKQTEDTLIFQDKRLNRSLHVVSQENERFNPRTHPFSYIVLGHRSGYDKLDAVYRARFGYILIQAKRIHLAGLHDVKIFEVRQNGLRGLVVDGKKGQEHIVRAMLLGKSESRRIDLNLRSPEPIDEDYLDAILGSMKLTEPHQEHSE